MCDAAAVGHASLPGWPAAMRSFVRPFGKGEMNLKHRAALFGLHVRVH